MWPEMVIQTSLPPISVRNWPWTVADLHPATNAQDWHPCFQCPIKHRKLKLVTLFIHSMNNSHYIIPSVEFRMNITSTS